MSVTVANCRGDKTTATARFSTALACAAFAAATAVTAAIPGAPGISSPRSNRETSFDTVADAIGRSYAGRDSVVARTSAHPLSRWLIRAIGAEWLIDEQDAESATDEPAGSPLVDLSALSDSLLPLTWRMSPEVPEASVEWMARAMTLGEGLLRIGLIGEATSWLRIVAANDSRVDRQIRARRDLIYHAVLTGDSTAVAGLALSWRADLSGGIGGAAATRALIAGLFCFGDHDSMRHLAEQFPAARSTVAVLGAYADFQDRHYDSASRVVDRELFALAKTVSGDFDPDLSLAVLLLAADLDWATGMDGRARAEYARLIGIPDAYARTWSSFMLGSVAMFNDEYAAAARRFEQLCGSDPDTMWGKLACTLKNHSDRMLELTERRR